MIPDRTANTDRAFVRVAKSYSPDVEAAWEVYGPFGRIHSVWERTRLGTIPPAEITTIVQGRRLWVRIVYVRYID